MPQGSILGPALYTLYTCDFPEVVHEVDCPHRAENRPEGDVTTVLYRTVCTECGGLVCYADDSTYSVSAATPAELSTKLTSKFQVMAKYLTDNRLCINQEKTHMLVLCSEQKRRHTDTQSVTLTTPAEVITSSPVESLLGFTVHQDLGFGEFLVHGKDSLVSKLGKRVGALKAVSRVASFKTRLSVCSSLVISRLLYMLPLYAGCPEYMLTALQVKQNEAMRIVTKRRWVVPGLQYTSTRELLKQCNYMSVRQMAYFYSVAEVHKTLVHQEPEYLCQVVTAALASGVHHSYPTSEAGSRRVAPARLQLASSSFRWRASNLYARLPQTMRSEQSLKIFLKQLKKHTKAHILD